MTAPLRAPFPYFGGKRRVASLIWRAFGDPANYVEPFAGSLAVLLARPTAPRVETINDLDSYVGNFWRAVQAAPEEVARWADWPVSELDLHARHRWLVGRVDFRERMRADPEFYDAKVAGWWVWGISMWIGSGWCAQPAWEAQGAAGAAKTCGIRTAEIDKRPTLDRPGRGVHQLAARGTSTSEHDQRPDLTGQRKRPALSQGGGRGVGRTTLSEQIPNLSGDSGATGRGVHAGRVRGQNSGEWNARPALGGGDAAGCGIHAPTAGLYQWMQALAERLRWVRVCCGDFERVLGPSVTTKIGTTAVLLDPPYKPSAGRDPSIYAEEDLTAADRAREWAVKHGDDPDLRIALCGYEGEHEMPARWQCIPWKAAGGYAASAGNTENASRERIWFSPHCNRVESPHPEQGQLFREEASGA
jgi:hypothetical protein